MKHAIVIRHVAFEDLGSLAPVLNQQGYTITYLEAGLDSLLDLDPKAPTLLVVLGGPIGAYEERNYPFLTDELHLLEQRLASDLPTLGICLGSQLMARALGSRVYPGDTGKEIGWSSINLTEAGKRSSLAHLSEQTSVLHWHGDTFDLPEGTVHLASSAKYMHQAFSWGQNGLGLQFHPEVTAHNLEQWFIGHACEIQLAELHVTELRNESSRHVWKLETQAAQFWKAWLNSIEAPIHRELISQ